MRRKVHWGGGINENSVTTKDVVVTANQAKEEAKYESQQTTIITAEDIAKKQAKSVEEIIFNETGVTRTIDAMGRVGVSIRGAEPRHTLILIDGQPVMGDLAKYSGQGDELQRIGTENVERIEIVKGAASAKYGADAIGGVVNVITKKASKDAGLQVNVEGRRAKSDGDLFPYQNVFLRADSGQIGKFRAAVYGSKRDIQPIYSEESFYGMNNTDGAIRNSLRYFGDIKNIGVTTAYDINDRNKIEFNMDRTTEDLERYVKRTSSPLEPQQHFKRDLDRDTYRLSYTGNNGGNSDWQVDVNYTKMNEDDLTLSSSYVGSKYEGKNTLTYVDDVMHKEWNFKASANTQINDEHLLSYGFSYTKEDGEGSRLKSAPEGQRYTKTIDPWDYDKNLYTSGGTGEPSSKVYDYAMTTVDGIPQYDQAYEYYGYKDSTGKTISPAYTYDDYVTYGAAAKGASAEVKARRDAFAKELREQNPNSTYNTNSYYTENEEQQFKGLVEGYYNATFKSMVGKYPIYANYITAWNGKEFKEEQEGRNNRVTVGTATIKKENFFVQDTWQVNDNTILSPIVRLDHSDLFGSEVTFNLGLTHNLGGKANRRFKANIGTGYTEPGMGELYYNWEMYAGYPSGMERGRLGWYWVGNPDLKPEKSVNFDIGFEAESGKTSTRLNVFHNTIDDYMTTYFTGQIMDFNPGNSGWKWLAPPDMIYSFKNIGKAEITGVEAEINHQFNKHWSGKLGYTYLHAINKSDPTMPRQLLDKPQHKVDIGVTYENKGWRASLWGNYYIHMLDSNSVAGNGNYMESDDDATHYFFADSDKITYQKKTFGIWNFLLQKELSKDASVYVGVDNVFNHRDDDRAYQERVYKMGLNMKFGAGKESPEEQAVKKVTADAAKAAGVTDKQDNNWFIQAPFDTTKEQGVELIGDYRARWNAFKGKNKPTELRVTTTSNVGTAYKNMVEKAEHGFEQRLRLGVDARIGENTNVTVLGSASGMSGVDTMHDVSDSKGLNHQRVENIDVTQHANKWDFSVGRLTEPMGVTGYWFGKEYDGGRAVWTSGKNQVRIGYGDFSHSTGISDSAYTHATKQVFYRAPTKLEWLGYNSSKSLTAYGVWDDKTVNVDGYDSLYKKLSRAETVEEQKAIVDEYLAVIKENDEAAYNKIINTKDISGVINTFAWKEETVTDSTGNIVGTYITNAAYQSTGRFTFADLFDREKLESVAAAAWDTVADSLEKEDTNKAVYIKDSKSFQLSEGTYYVTSKFLGYGTYTGNELLEMYVDGYSIPKENVKDGELQLTLTKEEAREKAITSLWNKENSWKNWAAHWEGTNGIGTTNSGYTTKAEISQNMSSVLLYINNNWRPEDGSSMPLHLLEERGEIIPILGTVLQQDQIPSIDRAAFVQAKHQMGDHFGVQVWYLRSVNDDTHSLAYAHGDSNDVYSYDRLANIIGLGAAWRVSDNLRFSFDWGQNRTDFGRMMNGNTIYSHESGTSDFDIEGRSKGGTPRFWVARIDVGHADMDVPGSWNAFADYKYFQHGSFFGGNGTEALPDRYLDGIKSFTIGGGYVPAKDFLIEAFYTFDAKGIGKRDTLYGGENFTLGDYTRIQATFRF